MKFARLLRTTAEDLPELQCLFHIYKHLKKQLKQLPARADGKAPGADTAQQPLDGRGPEEQGAGQAGTADAGEEARFTAVLTDHLQRLNDRFLEREETCVIQLERLEAEAAQCTATARAAAADTAARDGGDPPAGHNGPNGGSATLTAIAEQRAQLYKRFVNFHGEVLLLVHWSVLAYTATVKILKKHHKRTGLLLRAPQLADLLSQPFCSSELMTGLARKAEACIQRLAEQLASTTTSSDATTTGDGVTANAAAVCGGGGPQDTVEQVLPGGGAAVAAATAAAAMEKSAAAAAAAADGDGSYGIADGSSPSCSQSLGEVPRRRVWGCGAAADGQAAEAMEPGGKQRQDPDSAPDDVQQRQQQRQRRRGQQQQQQHDQGAAAGDGGGTGGGGGNATFLRNLARLSDNNSATSLSRTYVLEQLVELQQYVDEYDKMDEDDLEVSEEDEDDEEENSKALTAGQGGQAAATAAAAADGPGAAADGPGAAADGPGDPGAAGGSVVVVSGGGGRDSQRHEPPVPGGDAQVAPAAEDPPGSAGRCLEEGEGAGMAGQAGLQSLTQAQSQARRHSAGVSVPGGRGEEPGGAPAAAAAAGSAPGSGSRSGQGSGQGSAPAAPEAGGGGAAAAAATTQPPPPARPRNGGGAAAAAAAAQQQQQLPQSSSGSAGVGGAGGSVSVGISEVFATTRAPTGAAANLLRRTQVALTMWEQLRTNASTPSTVIDPAGGQARHSQGGSGGARDGQRSKRRRLQAGGGGDAPAELAAAVEDDDEAQLAAAEESVADDSGSNSD